MNGLGPAGKEDRVLSIDVLRGVALLGIALMNIIFSGLPMAADFNPKVSGGATGLNLAAFFVQYVLFDGKMRGLFSMMFGASTWLLTDRLTRRGAGIEAAEIIGRRMLWLMLFGMVHAYLIWHGDILYPYALLGLVLLPMLPASPKKLLIWAGVIVLGMTGMSIFQGYKINKTHDLAMVAEKALAAGKTLTDEQKDAKKEWEETRKYVTPTAEDLKKERGRYSGSWGHLVAERAGLVKEWHSTPFYMSGWDMFAMMLVGIALMKTGVLGVEKSSGFYGRMMLGGYGFGLPVGSIAAWLAWSQGFEPFQTVFVFTTYQAARVAMTLGHAGLLLLICRQRWMPGLRARLGAVGQTAFSNYILHSVIYGLVFYGYGFGLFDKLQRYQLYYVVVGMWVVSLVISPIWLRYYRFGPLEWGWRSLTYGKRVGMRVLVEEAAQGVYITP